jgi:hypothetical protein
MQTVAGEPALLRFGDRLIGFLVGVEQTPGVVVEEEQCQQFGQQAKHDRIDEDDPQGPAQHRRP